MEKPTDDAVTITYEVFDMPAEDYNEKPKFVKGKRMVKVKPNVGAVIRIKTPYDDPLPFYSITCYDVKTHIRVATREIIKGTVNAVVLGDKQCEVTVGFVVFETDPFNVW